MYATAVCLYAFNKDYDDDVLGSFAYIYMPYNIYVVDLLQLMTGLLQSCDHMHIQWILFCNVSLPCLCFNIDAT